MLNVFNNMWVLTICVILLLFIIKKIYYLNKPFDEIKFLEQQKNKENIKNKLDLNIITNSIPELTSYYVGLS